MIAYSPARDRKTAVPTFECPTCRTAFTVDQNADAPFRPFCSSRCKMVDLGRWFDGSYTISESANTAEEADPDNGTSPNDPDAASDDLTDHS